MIEGLIYLEKRLINLEQILKSGDVNPAIRAIHKSEYLSKLNTLLSYNYHLEDYLIDFGKKLREETK